MQLGMGKLLRWERDFTRTVVRLALPITLQSLITALMHILDNAMIGQLGEAQLAGVTQANRVSFLLQLILFGMVSGASIFTAQLWGKRDLKGVHQLMGIGLLTAFAFSLLFAIPAIFAPQVLMRLLINNAETAAYGAQYLRIVGFVYLMDGVLLVEEAVLKSTEQVMLPTIAGICAILCNTLLNYLLIFGRFGFPRMEVRGGAIATMISIALQLSILLVVSYRRRYANAVHPRELIKRLPKDLIKRYYKTVTPVMLNETLWGSGQVMFSVVFGMMGTGAVAAISIFTNVEQLASITLRGMCSACSVLVGKAIGAKCELEAQLIGNRMIAMGTLMGVLVGVLVTLFAGDIVLLFNVSEATRQSARRVIEFYGMFVWMSAANCMTIVGTLRSGGDVVFSGIVDVVFLWFVSVPLSFVCALLLGWPVQYVYLVTRIEELLKLSIGFWRLRSGKWIRNLVQEI